jgi:hypothetical protein
LPNRDSFGKRIFASETKTVTNGAALYDPNAKTPIYNAEPDGLLLLQKPKELKKLPPPWSLFRGQEVTLELKMQGDPTDKEALQRALLQRAARSFYRNQQRKNFDSEEGMWVRTPGDGRADPVSGDEERKAAGNLCALGRLPSNARLG